MRRSRPLPLLPLLLLTGCASGELPVAVVDNPEYSVATGMRFLERGQYGPALAEFERARVLNEKLVTPYLGIALTKAHVGDAASAMAALDEARQRDGAAVHAAAIRVLALLRPPRWLEDAEREFEAGRGRSARDPELLLAMGRAYKAALAFDKATALLRQVLALNRGRAEEAVEEVLALEKIQRAEPASETAKRVALKAEVTRGELAALLVEEVGWPTLPEVVRRPPEPAMAYPFAADLEESPHRGAVEALLTRPVRGLRLFPDQTFAPDQPVTRDVFAVILEDILLRVKGDNLRAAVLPASVSPFTDLPAGHFAFSAALLLTRGGILEGRSDGSFGPRESVPGPDALVALRRLREVLQAP
ncbi:MAG: tetratricopeptide repeat protein [candidate division NC10 bacterium]|nr:tetratricopeptide repeat protein [candidate division NC10 bacterium]